MTKESLQRAKNIERQINRIDYAIKGCNEFMCEIDTNRENDSDSKINPTGSYWNAVISEFNDGSGEKIDITGTGVVEEVVASTLNILKYKKEKLEAELESL